ncbi:MAG: hypothetical protein ACFBSE_23750, partial [Prochloraceae cyanobacterium]
AELDDGTKEEQWNIIWEFSEISGIKPGIITDSGNKSLHALWKAIEHISIADNVRLRKLLTIALLSDPAIVSPHQPMRVPGFHRKETGKDQILRHHSQARYSQAELESGFRKYFTNLNWVYPEVLSNVRWRLCRRIIGLGERISQKEYERLKNLGYDLPAIVAEESDKAKINKTLVLDRSISREIKIDLLREILATPEDELTEDRSSLTPEEQKLFEAQQQKRREL